MATRILERLILFFRWRALETWKYTNRALNYLFGTIWYDYYLSRDKVILEGSVRIQRHCVVFLIFPIYGVQQSHLRSLKDFVLRGYSPVVVSNKTLSESERAALLTLSYAVIERPNFGYDFGGYREGILFLSRFFHDMEELIVVNDSVWHIPNTCGHWLDQIKGTPAEIIGGVANYCIRSDQANGPNSFPWRYSEDHPDFHYCSFALVFRSKVLSDARFLKFWRQLRLSNDKFTTVRRGEIGLGQWIRQSGHSHAATFDLRSLESTLNGLQTQRLREIAERLVVPEDGSLRKHICELLNHQSKGRERQSLISLILAVTALTGAAYALPEYSLKEGGFPFLKKSPLWLDSECAGIILDIISELGDPDLLREARQLHIHSAFNPHRDHA